MTTIEWIGIGIICLVVIAIVASYIQIRVWTYFGEKFLLKRSNKLKKPMKKPSRLVERSVRMSPVSSERLLHMDTLTFPKE